MADTSDLQGARRPAAVTGADPFDFAMEPPVPAPTSDLGSEPFDFDPDGRVANGSASLSPSSHRDADSPVNGAEPSRGPALATANTEVESPPSPVAVPTTIEAPVPELVPYRLA